MSIQDYTTKQLLELALIRLNENNQLSINEFSQIAELHKLAFSLLRENNTQNVEPPKRQPLKENLENIAMYMRINEHTQAHILVVEAIAQLNILRENLEQQINHSDSKEI